jgi:hypothetical protein
VLTAAWPEAIGETPEILFINLIEDCDHSMLDDLVLQRCDPQWTLPTIGFRNIHSPGWMRPISAAVNPSVQINKTTFQSRFIFRPFDAVHSRCSFSLQSVEAFPEQPVCQMVEQALKALSGSFKDLYSATGRPSIAPEKLLRALLLQILYTVRSERMLIEQLEYNLLFRWFVGLNMDEAV